MSVPLLAGVGVWAASLALYLSTLAPTLTWGWDDLGVDGGEFLAAANTFGIPHPPGYPTYTLLLKSFATVVPIGDFAYRGNLLSAVLASATVFTAYRVSLRVSRALRPDGSVALAATGSALGALTLATAPLFWSQATITEVYTLNALLAAVLMLVAAHLALPSPVGAGRTRRSTTARLALFGFVLGIGLGNHFTLLVVAAPLVLWLWWALGLRSLATPWAVGALVLGLAVYVYLPLRAAQGPPINWGNADTLGGLAWMLSGDPYQAYLFGVQARDIPDRLLSWLDLVFSQFNPLGLFIGLVGARMLISRAVVLFLAGLVSIVGLSTYAITYNTVDFEVLMVPALLIFSIWVGVGSSWIISEWIRGGEDSGWIGLSERFRIRTHRVHLATATLAFVLLPGISVVLNYEAQNLRDDRTAFEHASQVVEAVPDGSVVLANTEKNVFSLWYMRYVERPEWDVAAIATPLLQFDWYRNDVHEMFPDRVPIIPESGLDEMFRAIIEHNGAGGVFFTFTTRSLMDSFDVDRVGDIFRVRQGRAVSTACDQGAARRLSQKTSAGSGSSRPTGRG